MVLASLARQLTEAAPWAAADDPPKTSERRGRLTAERRRRPGGDPRCDRRRAARGRPALPPVVRLSSDASMSCQAWPHRVLSAAGCGGPASPCAGTGPAVGRYVR